MEVTTSDGRQLTLQLADDSSGITIRDDVSGLDPVKAVFSSSAFANQDGEQYQSARRDTRNITMTLGLDPDPTVTNVNSLRRYVYSFFRPKSQVFLKFYVDDTDDTSEDGYVITGYVESCESPMFTQDPAVDISIMNFDPDFQDPIPVVVTGMTTADVAATAIAYQGTVSSGFVFTVNVNATVAGFTMYYTDPSNSTWTMDVAYPFVAGDVVTISTIPGNKYLTLLRAGVTSSPLYAASPQSIWPQLAPGNNGFRVYAVGGVSMPVSLTYSKRYGEL